MSQKPKFNMLMKPMTDDYDGGSGDWMVAQMMIPTNKEHGARRYIVLYHDIMSYYYLILSYTLVICDIN